MKERRKTFPFQKIKRISQRLKEASRVSAVNPTPYEAYKAYEAHLPKVEYIRSQALAEARRQNFRGQ